MKTIPDLRKDIKSALKEYGLKYPRQDGSTLFMYRELEVNRFAFDFTLKEHINNPENVELLTSCVFVSNKIGEAINYIDGKRHTVFPSDKLNTIEWDREYIKKIEVQFVIENRLRESILFSEKNSFDPRMQKILSRIDVPGSHQMWHLAALSSTKQIDSLEKILVLLNTADRGGWFPYIKETLVMKAIEYAQSKH